MDSGRQHPNSSEQSRRQRMERAPVLSLLQVLAGVILSASEAESGAITIAGNGPELCVVEQLTRAFEKLHLGTVVEIRWDPFFHPVAMVKSGEANLPVAGQAAPDLVAILHAWDGIAVVVDITNPVREVTSHQLAAMFSGAVTRWPDVGGAHNRINLIDRPSNQHIRGTFETLGTTKTITAQVLESLRGNPACEFDQLVADCSDFTWNQLFYEVDRLSRLGQLCLTRTGNGHYFLRLTQKEESHETAIVTAQSTAGTFLIPSALAEPES